MKILIIIKQRYNISLESVSHFIVEGLPHHNSQQMEYSALFAIFSATFLHGILLLFIFIII